VQMDIDQQDYLGVLLGDPSSFGSEAGSSALAAAPAGKPPPPSFSFCLPSILRLDSVSVLDHAGPDCAA